MNQEINTKYVSLLDQRKALIEKQKKLMLKIEEQEKYTTILKDILCRCKGESKFVNEVVNYPIILGSASTRMAIDNLGELPTENLENFHTEKYIFPINYTMRRKFISCNNPTEIKDKMSYTCKVTENGFIICTEDGNVFEGSKGFDKFKSYFDFDIGSIEDFFGFNNPTLQVYIESLGNVSAFKNYVPIKERKKNKSL